MINNKDINYIAESAESVGIHVDEYTAISIPFIADVMRKMREQNNSDDTLDKIRAEIAEYGSIMVAYAITKDTKTDKGIEKLVSGVLKQAKEQVLEIIDKYRQKRRDKE